MVKKTFGELKGVQLNKVFEDKEELLNEILNKHD